MDHKVPLVRKAQQAQRVLKDLKVHRDCLELMGLTELMVMMVPLDLWVLKVLPALLAQRVLKDHKVLQVMMVTTEHRAPQVTTVL